MALEQKNIVIIGAGIIGLSCAVQLIKAGHKITLVDKEMPGTGTSFGNAGHIATEQIHPLASPKTLCALPRYLLDPKSPIKLPLAYLHQVTPWLMRFAKASLPGQFKKGTTALTALQRKAMPELIDLLALVGAQDLIHRSGNLVVVERDANISSAQSEVKAYKETGIECEWLSSKSVHDMAPSITENISGAIHYKDTGHVANPYSVCLALEKYLRKNGAIVLKSEVTHINTNENVKITLADQQLEADTAIIATGAFSKQLTKQVGLKMPLETERGYHIHMDGASADFSLPVASFERNIIVTPMSNGIRATGIVEFGGLQMPPREKNFAVIRHHVKNIFPEIKTEDASTWMGYRPSLPDHLPAIGFTGEDKKILCAFGHQHLGLTLAGITARLTEELIAGAPTSVNTGPFDPTRFS